MSLNYIPKPTVHFCKTWKDQGFRGIFLPKIHKILSKTKPWPLERVKTDLRRESYDFSKFNDEKLFSKNNMCCLPRFDGQNEALDVI